MAVHECEHLKEIPIVHVYVMWDLIELESSRVFPKHLDNKCPRRGYVSRTHCVSI